MTKFEITALIFTVVITVWHIRWNYWKFKCPKCKKRNTHNVYEQLDQFNATCYDECKDCGALW